MGERSLGCIATTAIGTDIVAVCFDRANTIYSACAVGSRDIGDDCVFQDCCVCTTPDGIGGITQKSTVCNSEFVGVDAASMRCNVVGKSAVCYKYG